MGQKPQAVHVCTCAWACVCVPPSRWQSCGPNPILALHFTRRALTKLSCLQCNLHHGLGQRSYHLHRLLSLRIQLQVRHDRTKPDLPTLSGHRKEQPAHRSRVDGQRSSAPSPRSQPPPARRCERRSTHQQWLSSYPIRPHSHARTSNHRHRHFFQRLGQKKITTIWRSVQPPP